jgi:hypothetical protein
MGLTGARGTAEWPSDYDQVAAVVELGGDVF